LGLERSRWLIARLEAMPAREIIHRFIEVFNKSLLQARPVGKTKEIFAVDPGLHFAPGADWLQDQKHSAAVSESVLANGPSIFGRTWQENNDSDIAWHKSLNGDDYDDVKTFKVAYRSTDNWRTDIRQLWELNRLVWLIPVAHHFATTKDGAAKAYLKRTLASYLQTDRPGYSVRWNSAIEIAVQSLTLLSIEKILGLEAGSIFPDTYLRSLQIRLRWLKRLPSKYSSENNHRVAEVAAQIAIASRLGIKGGFQKKYEDELSLLIVKQFWSDGFNKEQSFGYHLFTLDLIASAKVLVPELVFSEEATNRLQLANQVTWDIYHFCKFWPSANDSDEAQLLGAVESFGEPPFQLFSSVFGDVKRQLGRDNFLHLVAAGYFFTKSSDHGLSVVLMVDHGELGLAPLYAHAHADAQSIWLWANGEPILVEAGTFTYHSSEEFRRLLQGSLAHNSIAINGRSVVEPLGPFLWREKNFPQSTTFDYVQAVNTCQITMSCQLPLEHLGLGPALWKREIRLTGTEITISDELQGGYKYSLESHLIFDSKFENSTAGDLQTRLEKQSLLVEISNEGGSHSIEDFFTSPRYSHLETGLKFRAVGRGEQGSSLRTRIRIRRKS